MEKLQILEDAKRIKELVSVDTHNTILNQVKSYLSEDKFNYIVTSENIKEVKSNNTELNKTAKFIKDLSKKLIDDESKDINDFKSNIKIYFEEIEDKRQERLKAIEVFESETKETLKKLLNDYVVNTIKNQNIRHEFNTVSIHDMILLSNLTGTGKLTSKAKQEIDSKVMYCKQKQDRYDMRVLHLQNVCYQNGLSIPLEVSHIQGIINIEDEEDYQNKLKSLIDDEVKRHDRIKQQQEEQHKKEIEAKNREVLIKQHEKEVDNYFQKPWEVMINSIDEAQSMLNDIKNIDISGFECKQYASTMKQKAITRLDQYIYAKSKVEKESQNVEVIEKVEAEQNNSNPFEEEVNNDVADNSNKIFNIKALFQVEAPGDIDKEYLLDQIRTVLNNAGVNDEDLVKLEVV